jgi:hypothetical protein
LVETVRKTSTRDSLFGIATVHPHHAVKRCRIRNLRIEYLLTPAQAILTVPKSCGSCNKVALCVDEFIVQIMEKTQKN